ncbi:MAG: orotidine-5'-phosphate decarboxylase [Bacteroidales bacterium]|nr:orotidine-5'-phosphate decarboxylase [Bacteroidales bacterium]
MTYNQLFGNILKKKSFLCIGLDTDLEKIPKSLLSNEDPVFEFNKQIIEHTNEYTIAYKPNLAFYEILGKKGWESLEKTVNYLRKNYPDIFIIADAKRGDIGNTSKMYAKAFFENLDCDAITAAPYMGSDSVLPFLSYKNKWVILLALTSNQGAYDFQYFKEYENQEYLFKKIILISKGWGNENNMMYVAGATKAEMLKEIRKIVPDHFLLVPGVGAQGGSLEQVAKYGMNNKCGLIVNASRSVIYADNSDKYYMAAKLEAQKLQKEMQNLLISFKLI